MFRSALPRPRLPPSCWPHPPQRSRAARRPTCHAPGGLRSPSNGPRGPRGSPLEILDTVRTLDDGSLPALTNGTRRRLDSKRLRRLLLKHEIAAPAARLLFCFSGLGGRRDSLRYRKTATFRSHFEQAERQ